MILGMIDKLVADMERAGYAIPDTSPRVARPNY